MKRLALLALLLAPASSFAIPVHWSLDGAFYQGGGATGSFVYDADTNIFSDIALTTFSSPSGGLAFTSFAGESSYGLIFFQPGVSDGEQTIAFQLNGVYFSSLTNAGGLVTVNPTVNLGYFAEFSCGSPGRICSTGFGSAVSNWDSGPNASNLLTGTVRGNTEVSEPGTLALLGAGCFAMFVMRRRRHGRVRRHARRCLSN